MPSGRSVTIEARPEAITIDTGQTAALVVDMQNDFGAKGGMFDRAGIDISVNRGVIEPTARVLAAARNAGISVVYLKMGYRPDLSDLGASDAPNRIKHEALGVGTAVTAPDGRASRVLVRDTWNTDIVDERRVVIARRRGDRRRAHSARRRCRALQDALQRILRDRSRWHSPEPWRQVTDRHGMHHEHLRRVDHPRRDVQGLPLRARRGLRRRTDRPRSFAQQSRSLAPERPAAIRLGHELSGPDPGSRADRWLTRRAARRRAPWRARQRAARTGRGGCRAGRIHGSPGAADRASA